MAQWCGHSVRLVNDYEDDYFGPKGAYGSEYWKSAEKEAKSLMLSVNDEDPR